MKRIFDKNHQHDRLKVAIVPHPQNVFPPEHGSVANVIWESARRLASRCEVTIFARREPNQEKLAGVDGLAIRRTAVRFDEKIVLRIVRRLQHHLSLEKYALFRFYFYLGFIVKTALGIRRQGCQIVHIHNYTQFVPIIRFFNPHSKIILHMHCHWLLEMNLATVNRRLRGVDLVISPSASVTEQTQRRFPRHASKCLTVPNGVDTNVFARKNGEWLRGAGPNRQEVILFVGRLTPEKGVHVLLAAMAHVTKVFPHVVLLLIGPDSFSPISVRAKTDALYQQLERMKKNYRGYLDDLINRHGLEVVFTGFKPPAELVNFYSLAAVVVFPSFEEAGPLPILEAMSCGAPIVATEVDGIKDYLPPEAGFLVPPNDAAALAEGIIACLHDKRLCEAMGRCGRRWVEAKFTWERMADTLLAVYTRLVLAPNFQESVYEPEYAA